MQTCAGNRSLEALHESLLRLTAHGRTTAALCALQGRCRRCWPASILLVLSARASKRLNEQIAKLLQVIHVYKLQPRA
jgi:acetolactate synthase regulatory subunit